ncbi:MAG TPA: aminoglycoside adenylyltransferase domain-containing protein [Clostridia bacterium]|nr:aminoglycoside adenylyltransferase domain-containing protein [Clostridia bacterium]
MRHLSAVNDSAETSGPPDRALSDSRVPVRLRHMLGAYVDALHEAFPERVYALSLYGSLALGGFVEHTSDVDFLTVMVGQISEDDQDAIKALHQKLRRVDRWASRLDGEYAELDQVEAGELDVPCLFVADGSLAGRREVSKAGWLTLIQRGVSVIGPEPAAFVPDVPWVDLEQEMWSNLHSYWLPKADSRWLFLSSAWVAFAVLTLCRILFTMERHSVTSKPAAAEYALGILPEEWHRLIHEALRVHSGEPGLSLYASRLARARETCRFIRSITRLCDGQFGADATGVTGS